MSLKIVQRWDAFIADWKEYKRLRCLAGKAWRKLASLRGKITAGHHLGKGCIRKKQIYFIGEPRLLDANNYSKPEFMIIEDYCPNFNKEADNVNIQPCSNVECPYHKAHCEYRDAVVVYSQAVQKRREFWNNNNTAQK